MSMMGQITMQKKDWFAVRFRVRNNPGRTTSLIGAEYETFRTRAGRRAKRPVAGTGERVYVPELLCRRAGFDVFLPVRKEWRRRNQFSTEKTLQSFPLMPGWMFVGWSAAECRWQELMALDIVSGVMGTGGRPLRISEAMICSLMRRWGGGLLPPDLNRYMRRGNEFDVGDTMRVTEGPFVGFPARVLEIDGPETKVVVNIFGRDTPLAINTELLER